MNLRMVSKQLSVVALLIGCMMLFSLFWAHSWLGRRKSIEPIQLFEWNGFLALTGSMLVSFLTAAVLWWWAGKDPGRLFRKEAMAIVALSWVVATVLGALPYYFCGVYRGSSVRLFGDDKPPQVYDYGNPFRRHWITVPPLDKEQSKLLTQVVAAGAIGIRPENLTSKVAILEPLREHEPWKNVLLFPGEEPDDPEDRRENLRVRWVKMTLIDCLFESQSGFSTTGATVISDLEDPHLVPHCILFWRSSTHFLGGLGIIVLFVSLLGQGSAGKVLMRAEMPGPTKEGSTERMQHTALRFAGIYLALNAALAVILMINGMTLFDALCHAFGTMATGGFSTYNASLGNFYLEDPTSGAVIEYVVIFFMILAGTNFTLLYLLALWQPKKLLGDVEWRTYMTLIATVTVLVVLTGKAHGDFPAETAGESWFKAFRVGLFQVVSIITTTGYGTGDFNSWTSFARCVLFLLMFVGGCAGSTGGGLKVIRHVLFVKILRLEIEQAYHPSVVRPLRLGGVPLDDPDLRKNIMIYFGLILAIFALCWLIVCTLEPDATWGADNSHKLIDSASAVAATLNNIGPGLGTVGATQNYGHFSALSKLLFIWLMMLGRLEIFSILVLFAPKFWRNR